MPTMLHKTFPAPGLDLDATFSCGQAFRWSPSPAGWTGIVGQRWVRLRRDGPSLSAETPAPSADWHWLTHYLQLDTDLDAILGSFPDDPVMRAAVDTCRGLRLLRQDPWECLISFILSSTKQIVQIRQVIAHLCDRFGEQVSVPRGEPTAHAFPSPARLAEATETQLRQCKMGFRAPYVLAAARRVASGEVDLAHLGTHELAEARTELLGIPGVGPKIADCVLLFACGFPTAFPIDVWILRALRQLYFSGRRPTPRLLRRFAATHFGPNAGYAQQYLFHYVRTVLGRKAPAGAPNQTPPSKARS